MKYIFIAMACILVSCTGTNKSQPHTISLILDITDQQKAQIKSSDVQRLFNCTSDVDGEYSFRCRAITNMKLERVLSLRLTKTVKSLSYTQRERHKAISLFYSGISKNLAILSQADSLPSLSRSEVWWAISDELNYLAGIEGQRTCVISSDLMELSQVGNFYKQPLTAADVTQVLDRTGRISKNLHGIKIILVFSPRTEVEDAEYAIVSAGYKHLLESHHAIVEIKSEL